MKYQKTSTAILFFLCVSLFDLIAFGDILHLCDLGIQLFNSLLFFYLLNNRIRQRSLNTQRIR